MHDYHFLFKNNKDGTEMCWTRYEFHLFQLHFSIVLAVAFKNHYFL